MECSRRAQRNGILLPCPLPRYASIWTLANTRLQHWLGCFSRSGADDTRRRQAEPFPLPSCWPFQCYSRTSSWNSAMQRWHKCNVQRLRLPSISDTPHNTHFLLHHKFLSSLHAEAIHPDYKNQHKENVMDDAHVFILHSYSAAWLLRSHVSSLHGLCATEWTDNDS